MRSLWQDEARRELHTRLSKLAPDTRPGWGRMSAVQMVAHLSDSLRMCKGELTVASKPSPLRYTPIRQLIIYWVPWPKSAPTAPELIARTPANWATELAALATLVEQSSEQSLPTPPADHPVFGPLSQRDWGVLMFRHIDHHLRQFGV